MLVDENQRKKNRVKMVGKITEDQIYAIDIISMLCTWLAKQQFFFCSFFFFVQRKGSGRGTSKYLVNHPKNSYKMRIRSWRLFNFFSLPPLCSYNLNVSVPFFSLLLLLSNFLLCLCHSFPVQMLLHRLVNL